MITITSEVPSIDVLTQFESTHPESIRWGSMYKKEYFESLNSQGFWLLEDGQYAAEIILSWNSANVLNDDSISVLPIFRGKGYGKLLTQHAIKWGKENGFELLVGAAREGASWNIIKSLGGTWTYKNKNWGQTEEDYVQFILVIN